MAGKVVRIGCGSGGAIDRVEDALDMMAKGDVRYLCMDSLAERSLALLQLRILDRTGSGFDLRVPAYTEHLLPLARQHTVKIIANMRGANPSGVVDYFRGHATEFGLGGAAGTAGGHKSRITSIVSTLSTYLPGSIRCADQRIAPHTLKPAV